ncbi:unnamed protein product [Acidithrix sp. C25]|nr:unnamed protein product [Acidithrix sp. C25]
MKVEWGHQLKRVGAIVAKCFHILFEKHKKLNYEKAIELECLSATKKIFEIKVLEFLEIDRITDTSIAS